MSQKKILALIIGAAAGGLIAYLSRCSGNTCNVCPLTSNPWFAVIWGGLIGYLLVF